MAGPYSVAYNGGLLNGNSSVSLDAVPVGWTFVVRSIQVSGNTDLPTIYDWEVAAVVAGDSLRLASSSEDAFEGHYQSNWNLRFVCINPAFLVVSTGFLSNEISYAISGYLLNGVTLFASP